MNVVIYCECLGCEDHGWVKKTADLPRLPRVGEDLDGLLIERVSMDSETGQTTICLTNVRGFGDYPDSSRPLGRLLLSQGYQVCSSEEHTKARW